MAHPETDNPDVRHEESDVNVRAILGFGAGLFAVLVIVGAVVLGLFGLLDRREISAAPPAYPLAEGQERREPPEPRLQRAPRLDLQNFRTSEDQLLNSYQWVDRNAGTVRIPIGEAMKLTVQRGLPTRPAGEVSK